MPAAGVPAYILHPSIDPCPTGMRPRARELQTVLASLRVTQTSPAPADRALHPRPRSTGRGERVPHRQEAHESAWVLAGRRRRSRQPRGPRRPPRGGACREDLPSRAPGGRAHPDQCASSAPRRSQSRSRYRRGSTRRGRAMWKGKPVIGRATAGIAQQIIPARERLYRHSVEGTASGSPALNNASRSRAWAPRPEHVRRAFLITRQLLDYLALMVHLRHDGAGQARPRPRARQPLAL